MHRVSSLLPSVAAAALFVAAARPAAAQSPRYAPPAASGATVTVDSVVRTVARFRFIPRRGLDMPAQITVADSAGVLVASYRRPGAQAASPMMVQILDTDLLLQSETPSGVLTVVLYQQNDPAPAGVTLGRWWLGEQSGELRTRATR
jgi:hypothetical protein